MSMMITETTQDLLLKIVKDRPGVTINEIRQITGIKEPNRSLRNLQKWGLMRWERTGYHGAYRYFAVE